MLHKNKIKYLNFIVTTMLSSVIFASGVCYADSIKNTASTISEKQTTGLPISEIKTNAPQRYVVVKGDTLWGIAGKYYLNKPWLWPKLWQANKNTIANPHWIYPGQVLYLHVVDGMVFLDSQDRSSSTAVVKLSPQIRDLSDREPIPVVDVRKLNHFFQQAIVLSKEEFAQAATVLSSDRDSSLYSIGDKLYVNSTPNHPIKYQNGSSNRYIVFKKPVKVMDVDKKKQLLGYEGQIVAKAELVKEESVNAKGIKVAAVLAIKSSQEEVVKGDLVLPEPQLTLFDFSINVADKPISGSIVKSHASQTTIIDNYKTVVLNKGAKDGVQTGQVYEVIKEGDAVNKKLVLPDEIVGYVLVFKVLDEMSYALVMDVEREIMAGYSFRTPQ